MLFLYFEVFERKDQAGSGELRFSQHEGHDELFAAPSFVRLGITLQAFTVIP